MDLRQQYERVFNHFDGNGDGKISPTELRLCLGSIGEEIPEAEAEAMVLLMDSDCDGLLGLDDFVRLMEGAAEEDMVKELRDAFTMYVESEGRAAERKKESGCITPKSLRRMLSKLGESRTVEDCKVMIARYDLNGDGVLNFDEFKLMMS